MRREVPLQLADLVALAEREGLADPLGRACYAQNRRLNAKVGMLGFMRSCRPETARRWREHFERGGSLRVLSRTEEEQRLHAQRIRDRRLTPSGRLRAAIRRARRGATKGDDRDGNAT